MFNMNDPGFQWFAMRTTALENFIDLMVESDNPEDPFTQEELAREAGLDLFDFTESEFQNALREVEKRRW